MDKIMEICKISTPPNLFFYLSTSELSRTHRERGSAGKKFKNVSSHRFTFPYFSMHLFLHKIARFRLLQRLPLNIPYLSSHCTQSIVHGFMSYDVARILNRPHHSSVVAYLSREYRKSPSRKVRIVR
ncbi:hypothetical protein YC2023_062294 [Brassica napus]